MSAQHGVTAVWLGSSRATQQEGGCLLHLGLFCTLLLWVLHILYDAANSKENPKEHRRTFNVAATRRNTVLEIWFLVK